MIDTNELAARLEKVERQNRRIQLADRIGAEQFSRMFGTRR